ncbi:MAG: hypothetical protein Q7S75_02690 [bacterium]|nr:hypothetical protein [bacterium]
MVKKYLKTIIYGFAVVFLLPLISILTQNNPSLTDNPILNLPVASADVLYSGDDDGSDNSYSGDDGGTGGNDGATGGSGGECDGGDNGGDADDGW